MTRLAPLLALALLCVSSSADAQTRFRRPYDGGYRLGYGFDNDGGAGGCRDYNCGSACYNGHTGEDFATPRGTVVRAAAAGQVVARHNGCANTGYVGNTCGGRCGNYVQIQHDDGSRTIYCHMELNSLTVGVGARVSCGQNLGRTASSGSSSGPHLHFGYRRNASSASSEVFRGSCGRSSSLWIEQRGYREAPGTSCSTCTPSAEGCNGRDDDCDGRTDEGLTRGCSTACGSGTEMCSGGSWRGCTARAPSAETCNDADDDCDGEVDDGDVCEVALLQRQPSAYAPPRFTDFDGDGDADLCARGASGVRCWPADEAGFGESVQANAWSDDNGWDDVTNFATIRMGDIDGDGRADLCAKANAAVVCVRSLEDGFTSGERWNETVRDETGWDQPRNYTTLRLADVDGDGRDDLCARSYAGLRCWISNGAVFEREDIGPEWSNDAGFGRASHYGTIRFGDIDGDRRADACARTAAGFECWLSDGASFPTRVNGPEWSDALGWDDMGTWSTIRLADVDGDGRDDVCARSAESLRCHLSFGTAFGEAIEIAALSDDSGWGDPSNYGSLRVGDVDGDGAEDLCVRANAGVRCYGLRADELGEWTAARIEGPAWSDESGWDAARHYETMRLADVNGDRLEDLCARAAAGWRCHLADGVGFEETPITLDDLGNDDGWEPRRYWSTVQSGGRACPVRPELCNGRDDDCDGEVDEDPGEEMCNGADDDCDGAIDEHARREVCNARDDDCDGVVDETSAVESCNGEDDDCDGEVDEGLDCTTLPDGGVVPGRDVVVGGCGCRTGGPGPAGALLVLAALLAVRRRR